MPTSFRQASRLPVVAILLVLALYARALTRPFTSEDYLLLRFLGENSPWRDLAEQLGSPWLGISAVKFWRPVSTLLYGLEIAAFGARPWLYNLAHLLVHLLCAVLVWAVVRRLEWEAVRPDRARTERNCLSPQGEFEHHPQPVRTNRLPGAAPAVALLFGLYPLHPNAVVFSASFATIFAAAFLFAAFLAWLRFRQEGSRAGWGMALGLFVLALGSYEAAAVFPAVLAAYDHLLAMRQDRQDRRHLSLVPAYLPFFAVLGGYLLLRRRIFGVVVGGYEEYSQRLLSPPVKQILADLGTSLHQIHFPVYDRWPGMVAVALTCLLLLGAPLLLFVLRRRSLDPALFRLWLFAWVWALAFQAPFAFKPSVPGNGRYWYLAAAGVAMAAVFLARAVQESLPSPVRFLAPVALGILVLYWAFLLFGYVGDYVEAGRTARRIQAELLRVHQSPGTPGTLKTPRRIFLTRYPYFLTNEAQTPIAQVYHYGLRDAVHPPFVETAVPVWPLPPLQGAELLPLALPGNGVYEWDASTRTVRPAALPRLDPPPAELRVLAPRDGAVVDASRQGAEVAVPAISGGPYQRFRLVVVSRGNSAVFDLGPESVVDGVLRADFPDPFFQTMDRLYPAGAGGEYFWWIEARDETGRLTGYTRMRQIQNRSVSPIM